MTADSQRSLEFRLRKDRGHRLITEWSRSLSEACKVEISENSFLSLEKTEEVKRAFFIKVKEEQAIKAWWEKHEKETLLFHLLDICADVRTLIVILFSSVDQFIGAVRVPADSILENAMAVWEVVKEDLSLATEDLQHGLCLEENPYTPSGKYVREGMYELTIWGLFAPQRGKEKSAMIQMDNAQGQPVDPSTLKPPGNVTVPEFHARTHVPLPPK
jgi:hypothetical protein